MVVIFHCYCSIFPGIFMYIVLLVYNITYRENTKANIREIRKREREMDSGEKQGEKKRH